MVAATGGEFGEAALSGDAIYSVRIKLYQRGMVAPTPTDDAVARCCSTPPILPMEKKLYDTSLQRQSKAMQINGAFLI